jgi:hypothetical protein
MRFPILFRQNLLPLLTKYQPIEKINPKFANENKISLNYHWH